MDCQFDATADCRRFKFLSAVDKRCHFRLLIRIDNVFEANDLVPVLDEFTSFDREQVLVRSVNGPELNCCTDLQGLRLGFTGLL